MYQLEQMDSSGKYVVFPLSDHAASLTVGRRCEHDIVLPNLSVSRNHALITRKGERLFIEDLDSANGVIVNGQRIFQATEIFSGDEIVMGEIRLYLRERTDQDPSTASR